MWRLVMLLILVSCVGEERDFQDLFKKYCGEPSNKSAPLDCGGRQFLPLLLQSQEPLVKANYDFLPNYLPSYTLDQLRITFESGDKLWELALKAGAERLYLGLLSIPKLGIDSEAATRVFYQSAPRMFLGYQNFSALLIQPSMELYLKGNGQNPHSLLPITAKSKDQILKSLEENTNLAALASLFYHTDILRDADFVRELAPYFHLSFPFPAQPDLTVSLGALVTRKWSFRLLPEFFIESDAFLDAVALAVFEGRNPTPFISYVKDSNGLSIAYALLDDNHYEVLKGFSFQRLELLKPHPLFLLIEKTTSKKLQEKYLRDLRFEQRSYNKLRTMILAIEIGAHNKALMEYFEEELNQFITDQGIYPSFNRFIGHELRTIQSVLLKYGIDLEKKIPKFKKHMKSIDLFGEGQR